MSEPSGAACAPRCTIAIPSYQADPYLAATIESVLAQTMGDFEVVIVDDASEDGSWDVVQSYRDPRIRAYRNTENMGAIRTWNRAIELGRAPYVKLLCSDDLLAPYCLGAQTAVLDAKPNVSLVSGRRDVIDQRGRVIVRKHGLRGMRGEVKGADAIRRTIRSGTNAIGEPSITMFRRADWERLGRFQVTPWPYLVDLDFWLRLLRTGDLWALPDTVGSFRVSTTSWSALLSGRQGSQARHCFEELAKDPASGVDALSAALGCARTFALAPARRLTFTLADLRSRL